MARAKLTSKGQVTIPQEIRVLLSLDTGDSIEFTVRDDGTVVVTPVSADIGDLAGCLADKTQRRGTVEDMHKAIHKRAGERRR